MDLHRYVLVPEEITPIYLKKIAWAEEKLYNSCQVTAWTGHSFISAANTSTGMDGNSILHCYLGSVAQKMSYILNWCKRTKACCLTATDADLIYIYS